MFKEDDILWVRNVLIDGIQLAYNNVGDEFILHWSSSIKNEHSLKPQIGDIILIFQWVKMFRGIQLTHLVTPVDNISLDCYQTNPSHRWGRKVRTIAFAKGCNNLAHYSLRFNKVGSKWSFPIENLYSNTAKLSKKQIQTLVWKAFSGHFMPNLDVIYNEILASNTPELAQEAYEGKEMVKVRLHVFRERSSELVAKKKQEAILANNLKCECCGFDFEIFYPELGRGFIECHHKIPIHKGERITKLADLALVCSNCHRMLHRMDNKEKFSSLENLQKIIVTK